MSTLRYNTLTLAELLVEAERRDDPLMKELVRRLDAAAYHVSVYRNMLGLSKTELVDNPNQQNLFTE